jgi:hypothetical protein
MIDFLVSSGTDTDRKTRLLAALVEALDGAGTGPNDIMVFFGEIDRASNGLRHQSQASNHATVVVAALRTTVRVQKRLSQQPLRRHYATMACQIVSDPRDPKEIEHIAGIDSTPFLRYFARFIPGNAFIAWQTNWRFQNVRGPFEYIGRPR